MGRVSRRGLLGALAGSSLAGCLRLATSETPTDGPAGADTQTRTTRTDTESATPTATSTPQPPLDESEALSHRWRYGHRGGQLHVDGEDLFVSGNSLERLSLSEGYSRWYAFEDAALGSMASTSSALYVADRYGEGSCYRIDRSTGEVEWQWEAGRTIGSGPQVDGSRVVVTWHGDDTEPSAVVGLDGETGEVAWRVADDEGSYGELSRVVDGEIYAASTGTPETHRIRTSDGTTMAVVEEDSTEPVVATADGVYLTAGSSVRRVSRDLGSREWTFEFRHSGSRGPPVVEESAVYVGEKAGAFYRLDAATGEVEWTYPHGFDNLGAFAVGERYVWMADRRTLHAIDKRTGEGRVVGEMPDQSGTGSVDGLTVSDGLLVVLTDAVNAYDVTATS